MAKIKAVLGGSTEDENALHFSYWTAVGLGHEKTIAIYYPATNRLEIHHNNAASLSGILQALKEYRETHNIKPEPVQVVYW